MRGTERIVTDRALGWFEFGKSHDGKLVDIANVDSDVINGVSPRLAAILIKTRADYIEQLRLRLNDAGQDVIDEFYKKVPDKSL